MSLDKVCGNPEMDERREGGGPGGGGGVVGQIVPVFYAIEV